MNQPTVSDLRGDTRINWDTTFHLPTGAPDPLVLEIAIAWAYVEEVTGQDLDTMDATTNLGVIGLEAVRLRVVQQAAFKSGAYKPLTNSQSGIVSFSVPGYSETRASGASMTGLPPRNTFYINPWGDLDQLLWLLATDDMKSEWEFLMNGKMQPYFGIAHETEQIPLFGIERNLFGV